MPIQMDVVYDFDPSSFDIGSIPDSELRWSATVCPYCGVGCGLLAGEKDGKIHKVRGQVSHPANKGLLCAKGASLAQVLDTPDRLSYPMARASRSDPFERLSWDAAFARVSQAIRSAVAEHGPDSFAFYISGQLLTEDYYVINKFAKGFLGTNNVDSNSRLCMASAVTGYTTSFGADGPPACYEDIETSDCFFLIGTNTAACHPVTFARIKIRKAKDPNVKVIVVDPRRTATCDIADLHLPIRPGTDVALLNGLLHVLIKRGWIDADFIQKHTNGWEEITRLAEAYTPEKTAAWCGVEVADILRAAEWFGTSKTALSFWSMGLNQSSSGTAKNNGVIHLHMATGKIGKPGSGPFSLTGQPNAMGGRETGGLCHLLPGHRSVAVASHREAVEKHWRVPAGRISPKPGLNAVELFRSAREGKIKVLWVIATNPLVSLPDAGRVKEALERVDLLIVQDAYHPTETSQMADILFAAAQWSERDGTCTNSERRVSYLSKIIEPPGEALPDWKIVARTAQHTTSDPGFEFETAQQVFDEYRMLTAGTDMDLSGMTYERLRAAPLQWPCPEGSSEGAKRLYTDGRFGTEDGRARFRANDYKEPAEMPDAGFPMVLTTGRVRDQWHTMTRTGKVDGLLRSEPYAFLEIHPKDADELRVREGDDVEIVTRRGRARAPARLTERIRKGTCFMPFHWGGLFGDAAVNYATNDAYDEFSKQPELKFCACRLEKVDERLRSQLF